MKRRDFLKNAGLASGALLPALPGLAWAMGDPGVSREAIGVAHPFDYAWLKGHARHLAGQTYHSPKIELPEAIRDLTWDQYQAIRYKSDKAIWARDPDSNFRLEFFHLGLNFKTPVKMYEVVDGQAREIVYRTELFSFKD